MPHPSDAMVAVAVFYVMDSDKASVTALSSEDVTRDLLELLN